MSQMVPQLCGLLRDKRMRSSFWQALPLDGDNPVDYLRRHLSGDWGDVDEHDRAENDYSAGNGLRLLSPYRLIDRTRNWLITEADRSVTTFLLPEEY